MPRRARTIAGGYVYHILNRANDRHRLFETEHDFAVFEQVLDEAQERVRLRILAYVIMPNHWHFVVWPRPEEDTAVSDFFGWLSLTHSQRWRTFHGNSGAGHVYCTF
ncbi:MAG: transposase [Pirellulales bacterium]|nr:transposase [Pirellulales bacterium]